MKNSQGIFISSTFLDMQSERDIIRDKIVPDFCEQTRAYGLHVEAIDLRWGINTEEIGENEAGVKILQTCFDEIRRTRPFFILLVGERYGWIPEEKDVLAALSNSDVTDLDITGKSVTELEFTYAVKAYATTNRCFFYFREPVDFGEDAAAREKYVSEDKARLDKFKRVVAESFPEQVRRYRATWDPASKQFVGLDDFEKQVKKDIGAELQRLLSEMSAPKNWAEELGNVQKMFIEGATTTFSGRTRELAQAAAFLSDTAHNIFVIKGNSGSGKSSLMAKIAEEAMAEGRLVLPFFVGGHAKSVTAENLLAYFCYRLHIEREGEVEEGFFDKSADEMYKDMYATLAKVAEEKEVVLLIDALDQFAQTVYEKNFKWLNASALPANVKIIMSTTDDYYQVKYLDTLDRVRLDLDYFAEEDIRDVTVRYFNTHHKEVPAPVVRAIVEKRNKGRSCSADPIYLLTILQELNYLDSSDFAQIDRYKAEGYAPNDAIVKHLSDIVASAPETMDALLDDFAKKASVKLGAKSTDLYLCIIANSVGGAPEGFIERVSRKLDVPFDSATFSYFRKLFATQLGLKENGQWDFNHGTIKAFYARRVAAELFAEAICAAAADVLLEEENTSFKRANLAHFLALTHRMEEFVDFWKQDYTSEETEDAVVRELQKDVTRTAPLLRGAGEALPAVTERFLALLSGRRFSDEESEYIVCCLLDRLYEEKARFPAPYETVCALYTTLGDVAIEYGYYTYATDVYALAMRTAEKTGCTARLAAAYPRMETAERLNGSLFLRRTFRKHQAFLRGESKNAETSGDAFRLSVAAKNKKSEVRRRYLEARAAAEDEKASVALLTDYLMTVSSDKELRLAEADITEAQAYVADRENVPSARLSYALWRSLSMRDAASAAEYLQTALRIVRSNAEDASVELLELYDCILRDAFCYARIHGETGAACDLVKERSTVLRRLQYLRADYRLADETVRAYQEVKKYRPTDYDAELHRRYKADRRRLLRGQREPESIVSDKLFALTCFVIAGLYFILAPISLFTFGAYFAFLNGQSYDHMTSNVISAILQTTSISCLLFAVYGVMTAGCRETSYLLRRKWLFRAFISALLSAFAIGIYVKILPQLFGYKTTENTISQMRYTGLLFTEFSFVMFALSEAVVFFKRENYKKGGYAENYDTFVRRLPSKLFDFALRGAVLFGNELMFVLLKRGKKMYDDTFLLMQPMWHYILAGIIGGFMLLRVVRLLIVRRYIKKHG